MYRDIIKFEHDLKSSSFQDKLVMDFTFSFVFFYYPNKIY